MAYPEKRKGKLTGRWQVDFVVKGQRYNPPAFDTMPEADGYEAYVRASGVAPPSHAKHKATGTTFREVALMCREAGGPRKGKWKQGRDHSVGQRLDYVIDHLGNLDIAAVGTQELDGLVASLRKRPGRLNDRMSNGTINRYLTMASAVLSFASARGLITGRPVVPLQEETGSRDEVVSEELEDAMLGWLVTHGWPREALCIRVLIETGMRLGELYVLSPEQVGNEWIRLHASQTKTQKAREIYISPELAGELRQMIAAGEVPEAFLLRNHFDKAVKACGGSEALVLHSLRHTRATRLLQGGVDPQVTMQMMGWTSYSTMMRYRHVNSVMHVEAAKKVSRSRGDFGNSGAVVPFERRKGPKEINSLQGDTDAPEALSVHQADL